MAVGAFVRKIWTFLKRKIFKEPPEPKVIVEQSRGAIFIDIDCPEPGRISRILGFFAKHKVKLITAILTIVAGRFMYDLLVHLFKL